jgi:hypothetical protein
MTTTQFQALSKLMRLRKSPSAMAAYRHIVHGDRVVDAAQYADCTTRAASNCIARVKAALKLAKESTS